MLFKKKLDESIGKQNRVWVNKGSKFFNKSVKSLLQDNDIKLSSTGSEVKSVVSERFIRTLKNEMYNYMNSASKNVNIDKLDDIVNKYNNTYNSTVKMKLSDVKPSTYIGFGIKNNDKDPKFKVGYHVRISKYKHILAKVSTTNLSEEVFVIKNVKKLVSRT